VILVPICPDSFGLIEVKELCQKGSATMAFAPRVLVNVALAVKKCLCVVLLMRPTGCALAGTLDDLVEFSAAEPHAPALWTVINFDTVALCDLEVGGTHWTLHVVLLATGSIR
jgi:hypothetical protein